MEIHLEAVMKRVYRYTWRPRSCALGDCNHVTLKIHLEPAMEQVWNGPWRLGITDFGDAPGGHNQARVWMYWEAMTLRAQRL
jgi:hypothetical protein